MADDALGEEADVTPDTATRHQAEQADAGLPATGDDAWALLQELKRLAARDADRAAPELARLFASGSPSTGIDGRTEGMLVTPLVQPQADRAIRALTRRRMPWIGKRFDAEAGTGVNLLAGWTRWQVRLLWPRYGGLGSDADALTAFSFETRTEPSALDDDLEVLAIDYGAVPENPSLLIRSIRDELVRLAGEVHLGRALYRRGGRHTLVGYFALRETPQT